MDVSEDENQSSDSGRDSSDLEEELKVKSEAQEQAAKSKRKKIKIKEVVYKSDERVSISDDVYNLTIAANMTKNVRPESLIYCIRQCIIVFVIQMSVAWYFSFEVRFLSKFQTFKV